MERQQIVYDNNAEEEGRLEQLPEALLQHILFYLGRKDAAQVGMLSKTLYDAWSLQPILTFCFSKVQKNGGDDEEEEATSDDEDEETTSDDEEEEAASDDDEEETTSDDEEDEATNDIEEGRKSFINYVNKSLQRYSNQNRCPQQLHLTMVCRSKPSPSPLVERLLGHIEESGVPAIHINFYTPTLSRSRYQPKKLYPDLFRVLECKMLVELEAEGCQFNQQIDKRLVRCSLLRKLILDNFHMDDATLGSIISTCPMLENLALRDIKSLKRIKLVNLHCLKEFFVTCELEGEIEVEVEVEAPSLEKVYLDFTGQFKLHPSNHLKKLGLCLVNIPDKFLKNLADNFPKLEDLSLLACDIFERFKIESKSLRCLSIQGMREKAEIDAPNLISFEYVYMKSLIPCFNSMETMATSCIRECDIDIELVHPVLQDSEWFVDLKKMLKKLIGFKITLSMHGFKYDDNEISNDEESDEEYHDDEISSEVYDDDEFSNNNTMEPGIEVEELILMIKGISSWSQYYYSSVLENLFRSCRPKFICFNWHGDHGDKPFLDFFCQKLMDNEFGWKDDLKETKIGMLEMLEEKVIVASVDCETFVHRLSNFWATQ